jgi:hypothetical protein
MVLEVELRAQVVALALVESGPEGIPPFSEPVEHGAHGFLVGAVVVPG